jgi:choline dehydrogenase-like flavoprotein
MTEENTDLQLNFTTWSYAGRDRRGVDRLRVMIPSASVGNTNAPSTMIGEKASAMILEDAPLSA